MRVRAFYRRHEAIFERGEGLFLGNTVLGAGMVIAPVIVAANTLYNALVLGTAFFAITFFTLLFVRLIPKSAPYMVRVILYVLTAGALYLPIALLLWLVFRENIVLVGIFLPLLITNSLIVTKSETRFLKQEILPMMLDVLMHTLGFFVVIVLVGTLRELLGNATLMGQPVEILPFKLPILMMPFGGFILVGFLSAGLQRLRGYLMDEPPALDPAQLYETRESRLR